MKKKAKKKTGRPGPDPTDTLLNLVTKTDSLDDEVLKFFKTRTTATLFDIGAVIDVTLKDLQDSIRRLQDRGYQIEMDEHGLSKQTVTKPGGFESHWLSVSSGGWMKIGMISDNQLGNKHSRLDVLQTAYDHYEAEGITAVYHAGNIIDGYLPRINAFELVEAAGPSIERQCQYAASVYPKKEGITTYFVTGDCHEGWYAKTSGLNVGEAMEQRFRKWGRTDLVYKGHVEFDYELRPDGLAKGARGPILRAMHPGGGTSYAKSYKAQKWAASLEGGEKPQIALIGHYHKMGYFMERNIHCFLAGCTSDQSIFMRKHQLLAEVGYRILDIQVDQKNGAIQRIREEWVPFFNRAYYDPETAGSTYERF